MKEKLIKIGDRNEFRAPFAPISSASVPPLTIDPHHSVGARHGYKLEGPPLDEIRCDIAGFLVLSEIV